MFPFDDVIMKNSRVNKAKIKYNNVNEWKWNWFGEGKDFFDNANLCCCHQGHREIHYSDVIMSGMASEITSVSTVCSNVCSYEDQRKHQSSASLACAGNSPVTNEFPHKRLVTRKMFPFDDVFIILLRPSWVESSGSHFNDGNWI